MASNLNERPLRLPPELAAKYHPIRIIGEGANGVTWLANTVTKEKVAIKALHLAAAENWKSLALFEREAKVLSSLQVEGIPRFYESHIDETGECLLVQQYIQAPSLLEVIKEKGPFSEKDTLLIIEKIAEILRVLHQDYAPPIIHRDIKPSNILYSSDVLTGEPHVWLIDFGAVASPKKSGGGSTIAGTSGYMAPEQLLGKCSIASDYYALGATALQMLTGVEPYKLTSNVFTLDYEEVLKEHAPKTRAYTRELLAILLSPKEEDRPKDANELCQMIACVLAKRSPKDNLPKVRQKGWFGRLLERLFPPKQIKADQTWIKVPGLIRYCKPHQYVEYTFYTKEGELICGADNSTDILEQFDASQPQDQNTPVTSHLTSCVVRYHPKRPMFNEIECLDKEST